MTSAGGLDRGLNDGEFVAAEPRDEIGRSDASLQRDGDRLQQFVADQMSERIVDALEFVDVEVEHGELFAGGECGEFALQPVMEQGAVRQVGQRVVMRQMGDLRLGAPSLGDVLVGRHPAAIGQRLVDDLDRAAVGRLDDHGVSLSDVAQHAARNILRRRPRTIRWPCDGRSHRGSCSPVSRPRRQAVHVDIALVADHEPLRRIEQQQALRHVVDGGIQPLLFQRQPLLRRAVLLRQLAHHQEQHGGDHEHGKARHADQEEICSRQSASAADTVVVAMITSGRLVRVRAGDQPVLAVDRTGQAGGAVA